MKIIVSLCLAAGVLAAQYGPPAGLAKKGFYLTDGSHYYLTPYLYSATLPSAASFSWVNQGGASEAADNGALTMTNPGTAGVNVRGRITPISSTTNATFVFTCTMTLASHNDCGVGFYESATGKIQTIGIVGGLFLESNCFSTASGGTVTNQLDSALSISSAPMWVKLNAGTSLNFYVSSDGVNWSLVLTSTKVTCFTTAPDNYMYYLDSNASTTGSNYNTLLSFASQ